jgi:serine/threonine protein phosphatase PrpC
VLYLEHVLYLEPNVRAEDMLTNELLAMENDGVYDDVESDDISDVDEEENRIPQQPVCGTVRTESRGSVDLVGKLLPGKWNM